MENFISPVPQTKFNRKKIASFMENVGGGLTQSTKSLTEKVEENPNWGDLPVSQVDHRHRGSLEYQCSLCQVS